MANVYNRAKYRILNGDLILDSAVIRCVLVTSGYTYSADHNTVSDITNEIAVGGYSRQTLTGVATSEDDTNDRAETQANQATFSALASGATIAGAILFEQLGGSDDGTDPLIAYYALTSTPTNGGDVIVRFNSASPGAFLRLNDA